MKNVIPILNFLMSFVPRSIISKVDISLCEIEIIEYETSMSYKMQIHLLEEFFAEVIFTYSINKVALEYLQRSIPELYKSLPLFTFCITDEFFRLLIDLWKRS